MTNSIELNFILNNEKKAIQVPTCLTLIDLIRETFNLYGTNVSCNQGVCGACTIIVDGSPAAACHKFAFEIDGSNIITIEGLAKKNGALDPVQEAFADLSAFQCGFCTSGMIMMSRALLDENPNPSDEIIKEWIGSKICRCTGYAMIIEAVRLASDKTKKKVDLNEG